MKGPIEYIKQAWGIYFKKENFIFFAKIMAVLVIITTLIGMVLGYLYPRDYVPNSESPEVARLVATFLVSIVAVFIGLWTQTTVYSALFKVGGTPQEVFKSGYQKIGRFLVISVVLGLIFLGGLLLLIIPAFIFGVWFSFSILLVLDKGMSIGESLKTSKLMVKGRFWKVFGRNFVFGMFSLLVTVIFSIIPYVGDMALTFFVPLLTLPPYLMYRDLSTGVTSS